MLRQRFADLGDARVDAVIGQLGDREPPVTAGIDARKGFEIHVDVQTEAMITTSFSNAQSERGDLGVADVNPGRARPRLAVDAVFGEQVDHRLLDARDQALDAETEPRQVEQRVEHELAGTVVSDLPAAVDRDDRDDRNGAAAVAA